MDAPVRRLYVLTSDGYLHIMDLSTGSDTDPPIQVLPMPYGKPYGLNLVKNVLYTVTGQGCGGVANAGDLLFEPIRRIIRLRTIDLFHENLRIVPAALGNEAGIIGCATLAAEAAG